MEKIINFPTRVQYTKEYLTKNPRVKQRQGIAQRLTRGHEGVVTIEWEGVKSIGHVHLDFLEEVLPATTMEKNTQLPAEVAEQIENDSIERFPVTLTHGNHVRPILMQRAAYVTGATAYASKLQEAQQENAELHRQNDKMKQQAIGWVKGAPKEGKQHFAKVPSALDDDVFYDAIIWPIDGSDHWWCVGEGFKFTTHKDNIIAHIDEQPAAGKEEDARCAVFVPCTEDDADCCGGYTSNDGRSLCYVKEVLVPSSAFKQQKEK